MNNTEFVYGIHPVEMLLQKHPEKIKELFVTESVEKNQLDNIISLAKKQSLKWQIISKGKIDKMLGQTDAVHQGVLAVISKMFFPAEKELKTFLTKNDQKNSIVLILDGLEDARNLGAIIRSAKALNVDCLILSKNNAVMPNSVVYKTSVGTIFTLPIFIVANLVSAIKLLKEHEYWVYSASLENKTSLHEVNFSPKSALVLGAEGSGLKRLTKENCDFTFSIPMNEEVESLNVSVAAGISLYEMSRQLKKRS